jgi:hypothetical protein
MVPMTEFNETNILITKDEVIIHCDHKATQRQLEKFGWVGELVDKHGTMRYDVPRDEFRIAKKSKRNLSEAERKRRSDAARVNFHDE